MSSYTTIINGKKHKVTVLPNGECQHDPPLDNNELALRESRFKDVAESRSCPGLRTDTNFFANRPTLAEQFKGDEIYLDYLCKNAERKGYRPKPTDFYFQSLVRRGHGDGDPLAFIGQDKGVAHIKDMMRMKGISHNDCGINVESTAQDVDPLANCKPLADDIVNRLASEYRAQDDSYKKMSNGEMREMIIEKHAPKHEVS